MAAGSVATRTAEETKALGGRFTDGHGNCPWRALLASLAATGGIESIDLRGFPAPCQIQLWHTGTQRYLAWDYRSPEWLHDEPETPREDYVLVSDELRYDAARCWITHIIIWRGEATGRRYVWIVRAKDFRERIGSRDSDELRGGVFH
ncbi:MAG: hypothetical protein HY749_14630 [Gammaproteobacteria bacterium]|nr:hypothetical protein [Gammaproteobacteria bacterium]